jgi:hypothetical protein
LCALRPLGLLIGSGGTKWNTLGTPKRICTPPGSADDVRISSFSLGFPAFSLNVSENVRKCQLFGRFSPATAWLPLSATIGRRLPFATHFIARTPT